MPQNSLDGVVEVIGLQACQLLLAYSLKAQSKCVRVGYVPVEFCRVDTPKSELTIRGGKRSRWLE